MLAACAALCAPLILGGGATETSQALAVSLSQAVTRSYEGPRSPIGVGAFDNRSSYLRGVFSSGIDRPGSQARSIPISHLQQSERFHGLNRDNLAQTRFAANLRGPAQQPKGASATLNGMVLDRAIRAAVDAGLLPALAPR